MSARKRPSGAGSNSKRRAKTSSGDSIPAVRDAGTLIYMAAPDGSWPPAPLTILLLDAPWAAPGAAFELEEMRPGHGMGRIITVRVVESKVRVQVHPGKFGQVKRLVLVTPTLSNDEAGELTSDDLRGLARRERL